MLELKIWDSVQVFLRECLISQERSYFGEFLKKENFWLTHYVNFCRDRPPWLVALVKLM